MKIKCETLHSCVFRAAPAFGCSMSKFKNCTKICWLISYSFFICNKLMFKELKTQTKWIKDLKGFVN